MLHNFSRTALLTVFVLFGTVISSDTQLQFIEDPTVIPTAPNHTPRPAPRHDASDAHAKEVIHHWNPDRIANARPRDVTVDPSSDGRRSTHTPPRHTPSHHHSRSTLQASSDVSNSEWDNSWGGTVQNAVGRIYFEMGGNGYVCSGTVVQDGQTDRSIILTAAHCVYDDAQKEFAKNVLFIPNQAGTSGSGTDSNCDNDPLGCWAASFGVADTDWASRSWPANIPWDYAMYVVPSSGAHAGPTSQPDGTLIPDNLEEAAGSLPVTFDAPPTTFTYALGYSYSHDPNFMHCAEQLGIQSAANYNALWLGSCGLSGGASGGPWIQGSGANDLTVMSVNSWGYNGSPGMGAPRLDSGNGGHAARVFALAKCAAMSGDDGALWCDAMGEDPCGSNSGACNTLTPAPTPVVTPTPTPEGCIDETLADGSDWHDSDGPDYNCQWYNQGNNCEIYGGDFANGGFTANQACCSCDGGRYETTEAPTASPITAEPTAAPTEAASCNDRSLEDGTSWHDSEGSAYTCSWYAERDHCEHYGEAYANEGLTAQTACCVCQAPPATDAPTVTPSASPSSAPSSEPTGGPSVPPPTADPTQAPTMCNDVGLVDGNMWHDSEGPDYTCDWYAQRDHCEFYGSSWMNDNHTAKQACCTCGGGEVSALVQPIRD